MNLLSKKIVFLLFLLPFFTIQSWPPALENCGNTCFLNASIQVLYNIAPLTKLLISQPINPYDKNSAPFYYTEMIKLFENTKNPTQAIKFTCDKDLNELTTASHTLLGTLCGSQQDATEFLWQFLSALMENNRTTTLKTSIKSLFLFKVRTDINCPKTQSLAQYKTSTKDPFLHFTVNVEDTNKKALTTLEECFNDYFFKEPLEEYTPPNQNKRSDCTKQFILESLSPVLLIGLKRFKKSDGSAATKLIHKVKIPLILNLSNFLVDEKKNKPHDYDYELTGVIVQSGTLTGGHYWAYVQDLSDQWYKCNDSIITQESITDTKVIKEIDGGGSTTGYLLIYQKADDRKKLRQKKNKKKKLKKN